MDKGYKIASITSDCISEINELQEKLKEQTNKDIILVAYQQVQEGN